MTFWCSRPSGIHWRKWDAAGNTRTPSVAFTRKDPFRGDKKFAPVQSTGFSRLRRLRVRRGEKSTYGCTGIRDQKPIEEMRQMEMARPLRRGLEWRFVAADTVVCWFGLTSLQKGSRPKGKKKSNSAISPTGKYEVGNAALSLNGGGATAGSWVMMTAMMLMATDNRQATTNERGVCPEERAVCWD